VTLARPYPVGLGLDRLTHHGRHAEGAFPVGVLLAAERCRRRVRPGELIGAVVGRVDDDGVVGNAEIVQRLEQFAYVAILICSGRDFGL
jgi:hypothetical protein